MARRDAVGWAEPALLILGSLAGGPLHGYAIIKDIEQHTGARIGPGTLYAALSRLDEHGLVAAVDGDARRRPYRLTGAGERVLHDRLQQMARFSRHRLDLLGAAAGGR